MISFEKVISAILLVIVAFNCYGFTRAEQKTYVYIKIVSRTLDEIKNSCGLYPNNEQGLNVLVVDKLSCWKGPYFSEIALNDEWGNKLKYMYPGIHNKDSFDLSSAGRDGKYDTYDDINNWNQDWRECYQPNLWQNPWFYITLVVFSMGAFIILFRSQLPGSQS